MLPLIPSHTITVEGFASSAHLSSLGTIPFLSMLFTMKTCCRWIKSEVTSRGAEKEAARKDYLNDSLPRESSTMSSQEGNTFVQFLLECLSGVLRFQTIIVAYGRQIVWCLHYRLENLNINSKV